MAVWHASCLGMAAELLCDCAAAPDLLSCSSHPCYPATEPNVQSRFKRASMIDSLSPYPMPIGGLLELCIELRGSRQASEQMANRPKISVRITAIFHVSCFIDRLGQLGHTRVLGRVRVSRRRRRCDGSGGFYQKWGSSINMYPERIPTFPDSQLIADSLYVSDFDP